MKAATAKIRIRGTKRSVSDSRKHKPRHLKWNKSFNSQHLAQIKKCKSDDASKKQRKTQTHLFPFRSSFGDFPKSTLECRSWIRPAAEDWFRPNSNNRRTHQWAACSFPACFGRAALDRCCQRSSPRDSRRSFATPAPPRRRKTSGSPCPPRLGPGAARGPFAPQSACRDSPRPCSRGRPSFEISSGNRDRGSPCCDCGDPSPKRRRGRSPRALCSPRRSATTTTTCGWASRSLLSVYVWMAWNSTTTWVFCASENVLLLWSLMTSLYQRYDITTSTLWPHYVNALTSPYQCNGIIIPVLRPRQLSWTLSQNKSYPCNLKPYLWRGLVWK